MERIMSFVRISFGKPETLRGRRSKAALEVDAEWCIEMLLRHGHIFSPTQLAWSDSALVSYALSTGKDSLTTDRFGESVTKSFESIESTTGRAPRIHVVEQTQPPPSTSWKRAPFLYMYAEEAGALWASPNHKHVPLFRVPVSEIIADRIWFWRLEFLNFYSVWLSSGSLENAAYSEVSDIQSAFSKHGLELRQEVEIATGKPTFYFVWRHWSMTDKKKERHCPLCNRRWDRSSCRDSSLGLMRFDFSCIQCRLISFAPATLETGPS